MFEGGGNSGFNWGGALGGAGGIAGGIYDLFGAQNPSDAASPYYNQIPGMLRQQYNPYIQAGMGALPGMQAYENRGNVAGNELMGQYNQMTNDPSGLINRLGAGFHASPGYNFQVQQALNAANRASAAGGMAGSPEEQQQIAGVTNQLANQDYYNYLNHSQQLYSQGIHGLQGTERLGSQMGANLYRAGMNATNNLAQNLGAAYMNQGNLAYQGANTQNQMTGQGIGELLGGIGDVASIFGGLF